MSPSVESVDIVVPNHHFHASTRNPGPMALPKGNQQPDPELLPHLRPLQKTAEQKNMMR